MRRLLNILGIVLLALTTPMLAMGQNTTTKVSLLLSADTARPGDTLIAAVRMQLQPRWHIYWRNYGDVGIATDIKWALPAGVKAGEALWPIPEKLSLEGLIDYVYEGEAIILVPLTIEAGATPGPLDIKANITWQECTDVCVNGKGDASATLVVGTELKPSAMAPIIEAARSKLPKNDPTMSVSAHWDGDGEPRPLVIEWSAATNSIETEFFPYSSKQYEVKGETERLPDANGKISIRKLVTKSGKEWPAKIDGVVVSKATKDGAPQGYEVTLAPSDAPASNATVPKADTSLFVMLGFALLGGLILNIMPCVLPVIALKVLGLVNQSREMPRRRRQLGLIYGLGVLVSFLVLAALAIAVQHAGGLATWSSPFQNPQFRVIITVLITLVALNLFGVFEVTLSGRAMGAAGDLTARHGASGAFFNGVLATVLATPCTAPFLAGAVSFAFTQPPLIIIAIFLTVGVGLAAPFVLLCWQPGWLKFLPKPGLWMVRFKVALGFPMLATAVWLFWVTATRMGKSGVFWFGIFLVVLALAAWIWGEFVQRSSKRTGMAMLFSLLFLAVGYGTILEHKLHWRFPQMVDKDEIDWQPWSAEAVAKAQSEGHPVLVDFTADTCANCQLNKITSIDIKRTRDKLKEIGAVTLVGDFTDADPAIARELKKYDRPGVPLVLVFPAKKGQPPIVLPPALTPGIVLSALGEVAPHGSTPATASAGH